MTSKDIRSNIENATLPLKTVAMIIIFILPVYGGFIRLWAKVDNQAAATEELRASILEVRNDIAKLNPTLIDYKMSEINNNLKQNNDNIDEITNKLNRILNHIK
jgi:hypothetical protein